MQQHRVRQDGAVGSSVLPNPVPPVPLDAFRSERSRNVTNRNGRNRRHIELHRGRREKGNLHKELNALGSLYGVGVLEDAHPYERATKKRRKGERKSKQKRSVQRPTRKTVERTYVLDDETNTHAVYENVADKWRDGQSKDEELERTQVLDAETDTLTVYENNKELGVNYESTPSRPRKKRHRLDFVPPEVVRKRKRPPNVKDHRPRMNRSFQKPTDGPRAELTPERRAHKPLRSADSFRVHYISDDDEPVVTPEIPSTGQELRLKDPRLTLRASERRRRETCAPDNDPIESPNWSNQSERIQKPASRRRSSKETGLNWPNRNQSCQGPMKAEDFNPEISAMERRLFTPDKTIGLFRYPPSRFSTPRRAVGCLSPNTDTVKSVVIPRPTCTETSRGRESVSRPGSNKLMAGFSKTEQETSKKNDGIRTGRGDDLTLVDDIVMVEAED